MLNNLSEILKAIKKLSEQDFNELLNALTKEKSSETFDSSQQINQFCVKKFLLGIQSLLDNCNLRHKLCRVKL